MDHEVIQVFVSGRVQGVGFRYFTQRTALQLGISGSVRNLDDGRVEVMASGAADSVAAFLERVSAGPPGSIVESCQSEVLPGHQTFETFSIHH